MKKSDKKLIELFTTLYKIMTYFCYKNPTNKKIIFNQWESMALLQSYQSGDGGYIDYFQIEFCKSVFRNNKNVITIPLENFLQQIHNHIKASGYHPHALDFLEVYIDNFILNNKLDHVYQLFSTLQHEDKRSKFLFLTNSEKYPHQVLNLDLAEVRAIDFPYVYHKRGLEILLKISESGGKKTESLIMMIFASLLPIDYLIDLLCEDDLYTTGGGIGGVWGKSFLGRQSKEKEIDGEEMMQRRAQARFKYITILKPILLKFFLHVYLKQDKHIAKLYDNPKIVEFLEKETAKLKRISPKEIEMFQDPKRISEIYENKVYNHHAQISYSCYLLEYIIPVIMKLQIKFLNYYNVDDLYKKKDIQGLMQFIRTFRDEFPKIERFVHANEVYSWNVKSFIKLFQINLNLKVDTKDPRYGERKAYVGYSTGLHADQAYERNSMRVAKLRSSASAGDTQYGEQMLGENVTIDVVQEDESM